VHASECDKTIYLTFDTGNMSVAQYVADTLRKHQVKATFFLANEKTYRGDYALDNSWSSYWKQLVQDGHSFGSHTFYHTYFVKDTPSSSIVVKSQFGPHANQSRTLNTSAFCEDISLVNDRFKSLTGRALDPIWRAPGGKVSHRSIEMAKACGFSHVAWSESGFLGDELSSEQFSNSALLEKALKNLHSGDITMAHLGIWSRKDPWALADLEPLILGLKKNGFCFGRVTDLQQHPKISRIISKS
jgi:peptidoglycan/xylan/chitin deacetylase (PgdA/CDA1 family)